MNRDRVGTQPSADLRGVIPGAKIGEPHLGIVPVSRVANVLSESVPATGTIVALRPAKGLVGRTLRKFASVAIYHETGRAKRVAQRHENINFAHRAQGP